MLGCRIGPHKRGDELMHGGEDASVSALACWCTHKHCTQDEHARDSQSHFSCHGLECFWHRASQFQAAESGAQSIVPAKNQSIMVVATYQPTRPLSVTSHLDF